MHWSKKILLAIWVLLALGMLTLYLITPASFSVENIERLLAQQQGPILLIFALVSLVRGIFFIPSTPIILAGAFLFPDMLWAIFLISMGGVIAGATYIYFFTGYLEVEKIFKKKFQERFDRVRRAMDRYGIWIVIFWAFFPAVPTDIISYVAGVTRMPYWKFILGVIIGEIPLVGAYVFSGQALGSLIWG